MKAKYSEFVRYCIRFYTRYPHPIFRGKTDREDWAAARNALDDFTEEEKDILVNVYSLRDTLTDNVSHISEILRLDQRHVWKLMADYERAVAKRRGLI
ncbi:MAG: hypothetical protein LBQ15_11095 [Clostridium sp.]|jgi:hypothetical protein|nr:hypothetical protein [Clostridium sp.]